MAAGEIVTYGVFLRAVARLQRPFDEPSIPKPSQEELKRACAEVRPAYGKMTVIRDPTGTYVGVLRPEFPGAAVLLTRNQSLVSRRSYSPEDLRREGYHPHTFSSERDAGNFPLYGLDALLAKFTLWKAGVGKGLEQKTYHPNNP